MLRQITTIMKSNANVDCFKNFLRSISQVYLMQERRYFNTAPSTSRNSKLKPIKSTGWNYEKEKFKDLMSEDILSPTFRLTSLNQEPSPKVSIFMNHELSEQRTNLKSQSKTSVLSKTKGEQIQEKFRDLKEYLISNTQEDQVTAVSKNFGSTSIKMQNSPSTAVSRTKRPVFSPQRRVEATTAVSKPKKFMVVVPSKVVKNSNNPKDKIKEALAMNENRRFTSRFTDKIDMDWKFQRILTPEPALDFRSRARVNEYKKNEEEKQTQIDRIQKSRKNYTFKYTHLSYKTLKYTSEDVFKTKEKERTRFPNQEEKEIKKKKFFRMRGRSITTFNDNFNEYHPVQVRRKSFEQNGKEKKKKVITQAWSAFKRPMIRKARKEKNLEKIKSFIPATEAQEYNIEEFDRFSKLKRMEYNYSECFQNLLPFNSKSKRILNKLRKDPDNAEPEVQSPTTKGPSWDGLKVYMEIQKLLKNYRFIREIDL